MMRKIVATAATAAMAFITFGGATASAVDEARLDAVLAARPAEAKMRDMFRHPKETLTLFELEPGMTIIDALPGRWYGQIFAGYLGAEGELWGADYTLDLKKEIYGEEYEARAEEFENWDVTFPDDAKTYADNPPKTGAMRIGAAPQELMGRVDRYFLFRALHHLNRYDPETLDTAAAEAFSLLKPGGVVGVVQHRAPESNSDEWASGDNGYIKQSRAIEAFTNAGFILEVASEINANAKDQPSEDDYVWRLPPSRRATDEMKAIGESDRMTLKFRKPE